MAKIEKFEDIKAWQEARELVKEVYSLTSKSSFDKDYAFKDQIRRASVSTMSNIAEGFLRVLTTRLSTFDCCILTG